jgi:hypothetical protein
MRGCRAWDGVAVRVRNRRRRAIVGMRVCLPVLVVVVVVVTPVIVRVLVVTVLVVTARVRVFVEASVTAVFVDRELRCRHPRPQHLGRRHRDSVNGKAAERGAKLLEREARVEQRAQHHIARRAGETIEVQNS